MIASPCRNCPKRSQPKENCMKDCELLQAIQDIESSVKEVTPISGIDFTEESRFTFNLSTVNVLSVPY